MEKYSKCQGCGFKMEKVEFDWEDEIDFTLIMECGNEKCDVWGITYYFTPEAAFYEHSLADWVRGMDGSEDQIANAVVIDARPQAWGMELKNG